MSCWHWGILVSLLLTQFLLNSQQMGRYLQELDFGLLQPNDLIVFMYAKDMRIDTTSSSRKVRLKI